MSIRVIKPGLLATVQDLGRYGYQRYGVIASGAMDPFALQAANALVGNRLSAPALELTMPGVALRFETEQLVSIGGADVLPLIDGVPVPLWRPVLAGGGSTLTIQSAQAGSRCCLAVAGGIDVPSVMGSYSTYLRAAIGGFSGRALRANDVLGAGSSGALNEKIRSSLAGELAAHGSGFAATDWHMTTAMLPPYSRDPVIRVTAGAQREHFSEDSVAAFAAEPYRVTPQSDRMGYRLGGPSLRLKHIGELLSEAVTFGTVQVPPDGQPIVLMADRQTTGGYAKIAQVITADLPLVAQTPVGGTLRFRFVPLQEAQELGLLQRLELEQLELGVKLRFR
ncbi:MAG: hypothetical protein K0Q59_3302 [Paenibacillus sp.]|jgi:antagonist of KipI|nr:hypothetical protein [Paenibacillus sp.]